MNATVRLSSRVAAVFVVLCLMPVWHGVLGAGDVGRGFSPASQAVSATGLDRDLRANDLVKARQAMPVSWAASEQLFVSYLERAFVTPDVISGKPNARTLAGRWAEVHFRIVEYDFARAVVLALDTADSARRRQLLAAVRDYYVALERVRAANPTGSATTAPSDQSALRQRQAEREQIGAQLLDVADRFRALSFPRGELWTLRSVFNVPPPQPPQPTPVERADQLADQLGDELSLVAKRPFTDATVATAERLGLPHWQVTALYDLGVTASRSADRVTLERAANYLERARVLSRNIPTVESVKYWLFPSEAPLSARQILPDLWSVYQRLKRPAQAQPLISEALDISRPFGDSAARATVLAFVRRASEFDWDAIAEVVQASQAFGPTFELATMRQLAGSSSQFRTDLADKALTLAAAIPDPHERALTLEWYSRSRQQAVSFASSNPGQLTPAEVEAIVKNPPPFPRAYGELLELCRGTDEVVLTVNALTSQALFQADTGGADGAAATFDRAIEYAERAGDFRKAAQVANKASHSKLPVAVRVAFANRAIEAARKADDARELEEALRTRALTSVGASHESLLDLQEALAAAERYTAQSGDASEEVRCLFAMANEREIRGEYQAAIDVLEHTVKRAGTLPRRDDEITTYQRMTRVYSERLGEPALALTAAERARQLIVSQTPESGTSATAAAATTDDFRLAALYEGLNQPVAALEVYSSTITRLRSGLRPNLPLLRMTLSNRARLLTELGDYEAALQDWDDVLPLIKPTERNSGGSAFAQYLTWLGGVARVHHLAGNHEKALELAREAIAGWNRSTFEGWLSREFIETVVDVLLTADAPDEAIAFCNTYFGAVLALPIPDPVSRKSFLETVARAQIRAGRFDEARAGLLAAVEIDRNNPTAEYGGLGGSLLALGKLENEAGNYAKAREYLVAARGAANPYDWDQIWQIERALAVALSRLGEADSAGAHYESALTSLESVRERLRPEEFRARYGFERTQVYEEYAGLLAARAARSGRLADAEAAFAAAERKRAQILWGFLATGWSRIAPDAMPEQVRRALDLEARIGAKQTLLAEQFNLLPEKRDAALIESLRAGLKRTQDEHVGVLSAISQGQYRYAAPTVLAAGLAAPVRAALGPAQVLVEYLVTDQRSYALVVSSRGVKVVPLAIGRRNLRQQVQRLLEPFRRLRAGEVDLARLAYDTRAAFTLYEAIFAPVKAALGSTSDILIVPDDVLNFLPFEALVERMPQSTPAGRLLHGQYAGDAFLLRRYTISYLTSSAQLLPGSVEAQAGPAPTGMLAFANPAAGRVAPVAAQDDPLKRQLRSARFDAFFTPLPDTEDEVRRIVRYAGRGATTILTGSQATESAFKAQAGQHAILHFATHGVAWDGQPLYSTMILAPDKAAGDDGFLQAYEVLRTQLRAELVVLSGCETALGAEDWGQGLVGLVAAFEQAGARSVLATLWSIDESTADVMESFYRAMAEGKPSPAALRQAKLQLLQQHVRLGRVEVSLAHPFFWAPFILVGTPTSR